MLADLLTDTWLKLVVAALTALGALLTFWNTWRKERQRDSAEIQASRDTIPAVMRNLAAASIPMPALQVDQVNELFKCVERLCASMNQLAIACDRHLEETRRGALASERAAEESRRLQNVIEKAAGEAAERATEAKDAAKRINHSSPTRRQ
jgi:hypothetical protein